MIANSKKSDLFPAAIVILAGGQSRRMGSAKALLTLPNGERLLDYHVNAAKSFDCPVLIADNDRGFFVEQSRDRDSAPIHIRDYKPKGVQDHDSGGALVAILGAMQALNDLPKASWLLVVSCDSLISATMLWEVIEEKLRGKLALTTHSQSPDIICLNGDHKILPLLGAYRLALFDDLKYYLDNGERRVMPFILPNVEAVTLPIAWQELANFNTKTDFDIACQAFDRLKNL